MNSTTLNSDSNQNKYLKYQENGFQRIIESDLDKILSNTGVLSSDNYHDLYKLKFMTIKNQIKELGKQNSVIKPSIINFLLNQILDLSLLRRIYDNSIVGHTIGLGFESKINLQLKSLIMSKYMLENLGKKLLNNIESTITTPRIVPSFNNLEISIDRIRNEIANINIGISLNKINKRNENNSITQIQSFKKRGISLREKIALIPKDGSVINFLIQKTYHKTLERLILLQSLINEGFIVLEKNYSTSLKFDQFKIQIHSSIDEITKSNKDILDFKSPIKFFSLSYQEWKEVIDFIEKGSNCEPPLSWLIKQ
ncbi:MAG: hypothetical protein ACXAC7_02350 [Candidatus Hodarchaeales archaeon]|jgi:hypothetical protein